MRQVEAQYQTLKAETSEALDQKVQQFLNAGWALAGGGYYANDPGFYCQAITKNV